MHRPWHGWIAKYFIHIMHSHSIGGYRYGQHWRRIGAQIIHQIVEIGWSNRWASISNLSRARRLGFAH